ncbi:MAG: nitroreductase family protein [Actinobacteria bacterium]|nr:nitroreductase family protein [Actinomycetota bacterium]
MEQTIQLPQPQTSGGMPLMDTIRQRHSTRESYSTNDLPPQELSNILWAAVGMTREQGGTGMGTKGCHAYPTAHNWQQIDVYVARADGLYLYDAAANTLQGIVARDIRPILAGEHQPWIADVPVSLVYVADMAKMYGGGAGDFDVFRWTDTAAAAENVYLYCASAGLATVLRALFDRAPLFEAMRLEAGQVVTLSQPVGYPA